MPSLISKVQWYLEAEQSLGVTSLARRQIQKRFGNLSSPCTLTSKILKYPVYARLCTSDVFVFDQIFVELQYRPLDAIEDPELIIDCGANVGYSSAYFLSRFPTSTVIAIEPDVANFAVLEKNIAPYGRRCIPLLGAVWPKDELLIASKPSRTNSEWEITVSPSKLGGTKAYAIPNLIAMSNKNRVSILKIDIEGAEYELFRANTDWLGQTDNIAIELHGKKCETTFLTAIKNQNFAVSRSGELTICRRS